MAATPPSETEITLHAHLEFHMTKKPEVLMASDRNFLSLLTVMTNISDISIIAPFRAVFLPNQKSHLMLGKSKTKTQSTNRASGTRFNTAD